jgi:hypothetical protein
MEGDSPLQNEAVIGFFRQKTVRNLPNKFTNIDAVCGASGAFVGFGLELLGSKTCSREAGEE